MKFLNAILVSLAFSFLASCAHSEADKQKREVEHMLETRIEALEKQIAKLENRSEELTGTAKIAVIAALEALESQLDNAKEEFDELQDASSSQWANLKKDMEERMSSLDVAYNKVVEYFVQ